MSQDNFGHVRVASSQGFVRGKHPQICTIPITITTSRIASKEKTSSDELKQRRFVQRDSDEFVWSQPTPAITLPLLILPISFPQAPTFKTSDIYYFSFFLRCVPVLHAPHRHRHFACSHIPHNQYLRAKVNTRSGGSIVVATYVHLYRHRDVRPSRTEDYRQNGYENHPTTSTRCREREDTSGGGVEVSR